MPGPAFDPYRPPRDAPFPPVARPPLPQGIQRYGLDVAGYRGFVAKALRARLVRGVIVGGVYMLLAGYALIDVGLQFYLVAIPIWGVALVGSYLLARARMNRAEARVLQGFELLVSPRVMRRTSLGLPSAEIAAPEVTSIVEIADGLSIVGRTRRIFLSRAIAGYAEVRDHVGAWRPIESWTGPRALLRKMSHRARGKIYDAERDAVITGDPSLASELLGVRSVAMPATRAPRAWLKTLLLWALLILMFLAIWQFLSPAQPRRAPPRSGRARVGALLRLVLDDREA
jgi:hypothetical protein